MGIEITAIIAPMFDRRSQKDALRVVLSAADVEFVLLIDEAAIGNDDRAFLAVALRARIKEIYAQHERFADRTDRPHPWFDVARR